MPAWCLWTLRDSSPPSWLRPCYSGYTKKKKARNLQISAFILLRVQFCAPLQPEVYNISCVCVCVCVHAYYYKLTTKRERHVCVCVFTAGCSYLYVTLTFQLLHRYLFVLFFFFFKNPALVKKCAGHPHRPLQEFASLPLPLPQRSSLLARWLKMGEKNVFAYCSSKTTR